MRVAAALLLGSAAIDWPALVLDRAGVALLGLAAIALALPAGARRRARVLEVPRAPAIFDTDEELELDTEAAARSALAYLDNVRRSS